MPVSALLAAASAASLNLCADEYLLLLARPQEIASVSYLSHDRLESPLWRRARSLHANRGSIEQVIGRRPSVVLTMGGGGRASSLIARRLGIRAVDLRPGGSIADAEANFRAVASALGDPSRARPWLSRLRKLRSNAPRAQRDSIWVSGGGQSFGADSAGAEWLHLAGFRQRPLSGGRVELETLLVRLPEVLVVSAYRRAQISRGVRWLDHPVVRKASSRKIATDGRAWTCMGPLLIPEIERLRSAGK